MLLNEYLNRFRKGMQKIENYGYADSIDIREEIRANKQAILNVKVVLINQSVLHIKEYLDAKGSLKNNLVEFALEFAIDLIDLIEQNRRNSELFRGLLRMKTG